ncbi:MAG: CmcI family methyltransferase [Bryobacteraceae bacterium]
MSAWGNQPQKVVVAYHIWYTENERSSSDSAKFGPGPMEAVEEFLKSNGDFQPDRSREKFGMTFTPGGFLKRVR